MPSEELSIVYDDPNIEDPSKDMQNKTQSNKSSNEKANNSSGLIYNEVKKIKRKKAPQKTTQKTNSKKDFALLSTTVSPISTRSIRKKNSKKIKKVSQSQKIYAPWSIAEFEP